MNKSVLVTGAAGGTGFAIAERFAKEGYDVFIGSREKQRAQEAAAKLREKYSVSAVGYAMKTNDEENVRSIFGDLRARGSLLDVLVLNAANLGLRQNALTVDIKDFLDVIATNLGWNFMLARQAALQMKEKGRGSIVFISSNTAYRAIPDRVAYSASKSGILGLSRSLALDWLEEHW